MKVFNCKMCGARLNVEPGQTVCKCEYCLSNNTITTSNEDRIINLFNKANDYRRACEFDRAMTTYDNILDEDNCNAEAHWGIVLCKYGVEYVEDRDGRRVPTCHRTIYDSLFTDPDYEAACRYADSHSRLVYEGEANAIANIQRHIIEVSSKEKPYDVFICYKESDENGQRTEDSRIANDIFTCLLDEGLRVFFARVSLREYAGSEYEPHIFAALNSAKVMIALGSKREYLMAPWVRNEWSRFLSMAKDKKGKVLIPCYKDMDPYDLPQGFSNFEALDCDSRGFMVDLLKIIKRNCSKKEEKPAVAAAAVTVQSTMSGNAAALSKRGYIHLEDREFAEAINCFNKSLDQNPEDNKTYWGLLLAKFKCCNNEELKQKGKPIHNDAEYRKAARFADDNTLIEYNSVVTAIKEKIAATKKALVEKENEKVTATGILNVINECKQQQADLYKTINNRLQQLQKVETDIAAATMNCKGALKEIRSGCTNTVSQLEGIGNNLAASDRVTDKEKSTIYEVLTNLNTNTTQLYDNFNKIIKESPEFNTLRSLQQKQQELVKLLQSDFAKIDFAKGKIKQVSENVDSIRNKFDRAFREVTNGNYETANSLLS